MENKANELRQLETKEKEEQERLEREREEWKAGKWYYNPAMEDYMWSGEGPPPDETEVLMDWPDHMPTITVEQANNRQRARMNRKRQKEKLLTPIQLDQDHPMSEYEKLRQNNINELNKAMKESGLF